MKFFTHIRVHSNFLDLSSPHIRKLWNNTLWVSLSQHRNRNYTEWTSHLRRVKTFVYLIGRSQTPSNRPRSYLTLSGIEFPRVVSENWKFRYQKVFRRLQRTEGRWRRKSFFGTNFMFGKWNSFQYLKEFRNAIFSLMLKGLNPLKKLVRAREYAVTSPWNKTKEIWGGNWQRVTAGPD